MEAATEEVVVVEAKMEVKVEVKKERRKEIVVYNTTDSIFGKRVHQTGTVLPTKQESGHGQGSKRGCGRGHGEHSFLHNQHHYPQEIDVSLPTLPSPINHMLSRP